MESSNIFFVAIVIVIALIVIGLVVNEGYCLPTGVRYGNTGGYARNYGWPVGMPYDSFARQMMATSNLNVCAPNVLAANKLACPETTLARDGSVDYGSVLSAKRLDAPGVLDASGVMLQGPEVSYKYTYSPDRGPGRYGWNSRESGMTAYDQGPSGCGFKLFSAPPYTSQSPAGSFTTRPAQVSGECSDSQGYNLATGVM